MRISDWSSDVCSSDLTWTGAEGPAAGPLTLHGVHFSMPRQIDPSCVPSDTASCARGRIVFDAQTVVVDPAIRPLLGKRLRLDALVVRDEIGRASWRERGCESV